MKATSKREAALHAAKARNCAVFARARTAIASKGESTRRGDRTAGRSCVKQYFRTMRFADSSLLVTAANKRTNTGYRRETSEPPPTGQSRVGNGKAQCGET